MTYVDENITSILICLNLIVQCWINGVAYDAGTTGIPQGDDCNTCTCEATGTPWCTNAVCNTGMYTLTQSLSVR